MLYYNNEAEGWYCDKFGNIGVKNSANPNGRWVKQYDNTFGYLWFGIFVGKKIRGRVKSHRFIYETITGTKIPDGMEIDHIDRNRSNNAFSNLRLVSRITNCRRKRQNRTYKSSRYKGVYKQINRWIARINCFDHKEYIGCFESEVEAAKAYDKVAKKHGCSTNKELGLL